MNENEAIKIIESNMKRDCALLSMMPPNLQKKSDLVNKIKAHEMTIAALEKQIPKKPQMRHLKWYDGYNDGWCPCCENYVQQLDYDKKYCQECGQRLDWGEEVE